MVDTEAPGVMKHPREAPLCRRRVVAGVAGGTPLPRLLVALAITLAACAGWPPPHRASAAVETRTVTWLRVDPHHPRTVYIGGVVLSPGDQGCEALTAPCHLWLMRSTDGGRIWADLSRALDRVAYDPTGMYSLAVLAADSRHLYLHVSSQVSPDSGYSDILSSADAGVHWGSLAGDLHAPLGNSGVVGYLALDPLSPRRLYAVSWDPAGILVDISGDAGLTWRRVPYPAPTQVSTAEDGAPLLVADPRRRNTVYANTLDPSTLRTGTVIRRSDDAGRHWAPVHVPPAVHGGFRIVGDAHEGALLVGRQDPPLPTDRLYVSANEGRTWRTVRCPGDLQGVCPAFTVDNAFGAGASYAFVRDSIYRFHGAGPAEGQLAISAHLPFRVGSIVAVGWTAPHDR